MHNKWPRDRKKKHQRLAKKQKQMLERCLGVVADLDERIEVKEHGRDEETQGETQTAKVCVSPAPERKKGRKQRRRRTTQQKERDTIITLTRVRS